MTLPKLFEERMQNLLGEEYSEYIESLNKKYNTGLRVNTLKITPEKFEQICPYEINRIPWIYNGYYYNSNDDQPARNPYYFAGLYYIQEPSAMTPASLLPVNPGDKVLDLCAAPGGKSTELAAKLQGEGVLIANDISNSRAIALLKNIELFGVRNAVVVSEDSSKLVDYFEGYFDKILVDAPCSGEGMFRKSPAIMKNWEQNGVEYYTKLQKEIILSAAKMLKPGGLLLYSTCTFSPEENEGTISFLKEEYSEFEIINPLEYMDTAKYHVSYEGFDHGKPDWVDGSKDLTNCIRLWPQKIKGEGHFITLLRKSITTEPVKMNYDTPLKVKLSEEAACFINNLNMDIDMERLFIHDDKLYLLPKELPSLKGLRVLRSGLLIGEMKKNRFEPSQALACALKTDEYHKVIHLSADDPDVIKYIKCETIQVAQECEDGWNLICVDGYPLGWGKLSGTTLKNKYYPGWRWM